ncbi:MAG: hypothetical protein FWG42_10845, partial [Clostridiales bacterium]|nr:hypothetical protein [Clostridiales bacterium]
IKDPLGNATEYEYDALDRVALQKNPDRTSLAYGYNANGWLETATDEEGGVTAYSYYDNGWLKTTTDCMGGSTRYTYKRTGQVETVTDPENGVVRNEYDEAGNLASVTDPMGFATAYKYDENNHVKEVEDPEGGKTKTEYDEAGNVKKITNADDGVTLYCYDLLNRLVGRTDPEGNVFTTEYDRNGNVIKETDARGNYKEFRYDALNRVVEAVNELGHSSYKEYDEDGNLKKLVNEEGAVTQYCYNLKGQIKKVADALGNFTMLEYDSMGRVATETDARGAVTAFAYTSCGAIKTITRDITHAPGAAVKQAVTAYEYNANGWLTAETGPDGETVRYFHDRLGRVVEKKDAMGKSEFFEYDANSRLTQATDREGNATKYFYDQNGNVTRTVDAMGGASEFGYDAMNRLVSVKLNRKYAAGGVNEIQTTIYKHDKNGLVTKQVNAALGEKTYVYDGNGNLIQTTDEDGYVTMHCYDPRNLAIAINYSGGNGKVVNFGYNMAGELVLMEDWNGATEFTLDLLGQIKSVNDHGMNVTSYQYDAVGNRAGITYPDGSRVNYEYDLLGRMTRLIDNENQAVAYSWDAARLTGMAYPNGWAEAYTYNANGWLTGQAAADPTNTPSKTVTHGYQYDFNGNVKRETRGGAGGQDKYDLTHFYDALGRLTLTTGLWGYKDHEYVYDSLGNLMRERVHNKWTDYGYNALNQQVKKVADGKDTYVNSFDARGNFVKSVYEKNKNQSSVVGEYVYDATNRMVKGTNTDGEQSHYVYNGFGDLVACEWVIAKNAYGYTGVNSQPSGQVGGAVVCDRHQHVNGQGHQNPVGNGHTNGGTLGAVAPSISAKQTVVHKDYVLDYANPLKRVIMETEGGAGGLTYRYAYGLEKAEVAILGIQNGAGAVTQYAYGDGNGGAVFTATHPGGNVAVSSMVKLWYHHSRLGSTDFLTDNVAGKVTSYVTYDDWGALTAKAVLKMGARELDLVQEYAGHPYDQVLELYYAKARVYDAAGRRFMAVDLVKGTVMDPQTMAQYTYCLNNPLKYVDPTGKAWTTVDFEIAVNLSGVDAKEFRVAIDKATKDYKNAAGNLFFQNKAAYAASEKREYYYRLACKDYVYVDEYDYMYGKKVLVFIGTHGVEKVKNAARHASIIIFASEDSKFSSNINFSRRESTFGRKVKYATIGAGPINSKLICDYNRTNDQDLNNKKEMIFLEQANENTVDLLFLAANNYKKNDAVDYDIAALRGYNSNSFAHGLVRAAGINVLPRITPAMTLGWSNPVPSRKFL